MENILIMLLIFQAVFMAIGYFALARQIRSTRQRLATLGALAAIIPLFGVAIAILPNGISTEELVGFFEFYVYSAIANGIIGVLVDGIEHALLGGR